MNLLIVGLALLLLFWGIDWFLKRAPKYGKRFLIRLAIILGIMVLAALIITGRMHWLVGLLGALLPFASRILPLLRWLPFIQQQRKRYQAGNAGSGNTSEVSTRWLRMTLDHDTGTMTGQIIGSNYIGRQLHDLSNTELHDFYDQCRVDDPEAIRLLDAYIKRHCDQQWSNQDQTNQSSGNGEMTTTEACDILGLEPGASREEVQRAYKRMMFKLHPDRGGSNYLATKINQAKDHLLSLGE